MPFKSQAQRRFMYAKHPKIAKKWEAHTPKNAKLPEKVSSESFENKIDLLLNQPIDISLSNNGAIIATKKLKEVLKDIISAESIDIENSKVRLNKIVKLTNSKNIELENIRPSVSHLLEDPGYSVGWRYGSKDQNLRRYLNSRLNKLDNGIMSNDSYDKYIIRAIEEQLSSLESQGIISGLAEWTIKPSLTSDSIVIKPR